MAAVTRLNHAVLFVRELDRSVDFYRQALGFEEIARRDGAMAFLRAVNSTNHHDLGLFVASPDAQRPSRGSIGLFHLAWEVSTIDDLASARTTLAELGALVGQSDHGATKSLYGQDPDGNEFEVMWMVPRDQWGEFERNAVTLPLDLEAERARFGARQPA
jgi:catechol-2,3-dioxygenase